MGSPLPLAEPSPHLPLSSPNLQWEGWATLLFPGLIPGRAEPGTGSSPSRQTCCVPRPGCILSPREPLNRLFPPLEPPAPLPWQLSPCPPSPDHPVAPSPATNSQAQALPSPTCPSPETPSHHPTPPRPRPCNPRPSSLPCLAECPVSPIRPGSPELCFTTESTGPRKSSVTLHVCLRRCYPLSHSSGSPF